MASYKGVTITPGTDEGVATQVAAIDAQLASGGGQSPATNTMPGDALGKSPGSYASYFPAPTAAAGAAASAVAAKDAYLAKTASEADQLSTDDATQKTAIQKLLGQLGGQESSRASLYESEGVNKDQQDIDAITSEMESTSHNFDKQIETLQNNNPEGKLATGVTIAVNYLTRQKAATLADQAIVLNAKTRNYTAAKGAIDTKVDAETDDLKTQLQGLQYFYTQNESRLTDDQKTLLQEKIDSADREYQDARDTRSQIGEIQLAAAKNGAPLSIVSTIGKSTDLSGAIGAAAGYLQDSNGAGTFTTTQINGGAANAGLSIADFAALPADDKNYFINGYDAFTALMKQHAAGDITDDELANDIATAAGISDNVRSILYKKGGVTAPSADTDSGSGGFGGFLSSGFNFVKSLIGA